MSGLWNKAGLGERLARLAASAEYRVYLDVRERVLAMAEREAARPRGVQAPSAYWAEELENFEDMLDASPLIVEKLRHHTDHITGMRVYNYRSNRDQVRRRYAAKLRALREKDTSGLFVPEWSGLGGFGFDIEGALVNIDTLKYYEVLIALDRGAVLDEFRRTDERKLVWEIGAGWGGFPYQFKSVCPNVTYVIADFPELFLFSALYLQCAFPQARIRYFGDVPEADTFRGWQDYDFILIPNTAAASAMTPPRLDLTINMVSFQEMTAAQVDEYARLAHGNGCPFLYSLNRERSGYNREIESVSHILDRYFWLRQVEMLHVSYQKMLDDEPSPSDYKHLIGWRKQPA